MNVIDIRSVTRRYGQVTALDSVDIAIPDGSICGLLGRNGAGKTTLMSIVAGQDRPTSGEVRVLGHAPFEHAETLSKISYVRDNQRYPDGYRLHQVLRIAPDFAPNWDADVAAQLVDGFRIPVKTPIAKFSRGQLSSVAIVLGLAARAPVTLLDEPYLGLDVTARALFHDVLLRDYEAHPRTILLSTHLIDESESLFDRVVIMNRGKVVLDLDRDDARTAAVVATGASDAVSRLGSGRTVLESHTVGGLGSATLTGDIGDEFQAEARRNGVQIAAASLQQLVAAYGADEPETSEKPDTSEKPETFDKREKRVGTRA